MKKILAVFAATLAVTVFAAPATAQYVDRDDSARFEEEFDTDEYMVNGRFSAIVVPGFVLGWFWGEHENHWTKGKTNFAYGGEITWRRRNEFEIGLGVEWADIRTPDGWWQDRDEPRIEADWTEVNLQLLNVTFFTRWFWDVEEWFSPYLGVGIGPGIVFGEILKHNPTEGSTCRQQLQSGDFPPPACLDENGEPIDNQFDSPEKETSVPPLVPVLALSGGLRFNIADYGMFKLEVGFQDYFYAGAGLGVQW